MAEKTYTRDEISRTVNAGAELVVGGLELGEHDTDVVNLVVNAALSLLDHPDMSLDDVMDANYGDGHEVVRSWWENWS